MRRRILSSILLAALPLAGSANGAAGQGVAGASRDSGSDNLPILPLRAPAIYGAWVAVARHSAYRTRTGVPGHRDFYLSSIRVGWSLGGGDDPSRMVNGAYFIDVIPAAVSTSMPEYHW